VVKSQIPVSSGPPTAEEKRLKLAASLDLPRHMGDLMDAGAELLPLVHEIATVDRLIEVCRYERLATEIWRLLREAWAAWWPIFQVWDAPDSWAFWQRATGSWGLWQQAGLASLVKFWMERAEPPYQITHDEMSKLMRWLYGVPWQREDRPVDPPPFWVVEMLDPEQPGMEVLVGR
jgi:hypothetical protein